MTEKNPTEPKNNDGNTGAAANPTEPKTFTQEQVEQMIKERVQRVKSSVPDDYEELKAKVAQYDAQQAEGETEIDQIKKQLNALQEENTNMKHAKELSDWRNQVSAETGIPAAILRGETLDEIKAHADSIKTAIPMHGLVDPGKPASETTTKDEIAAIKNPVERVRAIARHKELYK